MKTINIDEFIEIYKPVKNHIIQDTPYNGYMFETFGKEIDYIVKLANKPESKQYVWTLLECADEEQYIVPGYFLINRLGYFITEIPWESENIQVNDNEMCTIEEAIDYCISFGEMQFNVGFNKYDVGQYFNENLDPTFEEEMSIGRAKYIAMDYFEDRLEKDIDEFEDELHNYYSQL